MIAFLELTPTENPIYTSRFVPSVNPCAGATNGPGKNKYGAPFRRQPVPPKKTFMQYVTIYKKNILKPLIEAGGLRGRGVTTPIDL